MTWDVLIRRGVIIDGSGSLGTIGDIALAAGRIAAIGGSLGGHAKSVIDAEGLAVTPGFIDIKTHSDFVLPINPKAESKVRRESPPRSLAIAVFRSRRCCGERRRFWPIT
jgi:N-acyl-D-amino-acid deacylase